MADEVLTATIRAELNQFRQGMTEMAHVTERATQQSAQAMGTMNRAITTVSQSLQGLGIAFSLVGLVQFTKDAVQAANQFAAFALSLKNATGTITTAGQAMAFVRGEANRLGLDLTRATEGFAKLANATKGTALAGEATREIFSALSEASRILGLSTEQYGRALTAISQVALKGRVQQEELLQLAEAGIPIYSALSKALGVTTGELAKMLEQGQVSATALGDAFRILRQETQGVAEASNSFAAVMTRLSNSFTEFLAGMGRLITESPNARRLIDELTKTMERLQQSSLRKELGFIEGTLKDFANITALANAAMDRFSGDALQKAKDELATTQASIRGTASDLEVLKSRADIPWVKFLMDMGNLLPTAYRVDATLKDMTATLAQLHAQEEQQARRVASLERARRMARLPQATEADLMEDTLRDQGISSAEEAAARLRQLRRRQGITAEEEGKEFLQELQHTAQEAKRLAQEREAAAKRQAQEDKQHAQDRLADLRWQEAEQVRVDQARVDSTKTVQQEIQRLTLSTTEFELLQLDRRIEAFRAAGVEEQDLTALREAFIQNQQAETERETLRQFERIRAKAEQEHEREERETARSLQTQSREYEQFAKRVQDTTANTIFDALSGRIQSFKDLLTSVKNFFLRVLSDMVAAAITRPIIIPVVTAITGALGLNELLGIPGIVSSGTGGAQSTAGLVSQGSTVVQALGLGSTGAITRFLNTPIGVDNSAAPAGVQGPPMASGSFVSQSTLGATLGAGAAGFTVGQTSNQLFGLRGRSATTGGVTGGIVGGIAGGVIGSVVPVIGTALGAFIGSAFGSILGGVIGSLFGKAPTQRFQVSGAQVGAPSFEPGIGITGLDRFLLNTRSGNLGQAGGELHTRLYTAVTGLFSQLETTLRQFPEELQERALPHLEGLTQHFEVHFQSLNLKGKDVAKQLEKWIAEDLPRLFESTFSDMLERLQRVSPLLQKFDEAIGALEQRQAQILDSIRGARQSISEALFSPALLFETRQEELTTLLSQFRGGSAAVQAQLAPQIVGLTQEVFRLGTAQEVFGEDREALRDLQRDMLDILTEVETATRSVFEQQITATQEQRQILLDQFAVTSNIEALMRDSVLYLRTLTELFQPAVSLQTSPGQVHRIGTTGIALVHAGEYVGRPGGDSFNSDIHITINAGAGSNANDIANATASAIRNQQRQLQVRARYRQRGTM